MSPVDEGTPQGGPLSPLLSNLVLDDLDRELERRGHRFCRYADDCNIYVRSRRAGQRVMASVCRFLTKKLRLKVNESKSAVARPDDRKFLGFRLTTGAEPQRLISPEALKRFQVRVRELTSRTRGISIERMIGSLKPYLLGWRGYFGFSQDPLVLRNLDARIRRRLRMVIWRQWGNGPTRFANLRRLGVPHMRAAVAAGSPTGFWAMSRHAAVQQARPIAYFDSLGECDFDTRNIYKLYTKGNRTHVASMNDRVFQVLQEVREKTGEFQYVFCFLTGPRAGKPFHDVKSGFAAAKKEAGITRPFRLHDLRHHGASHLAMNDVGLLELKEILGHTDIKSTMRYIHLMPGFAGRKVSVLDRVFPNSFPSDASKTDKDVTGSKKNGNAKPVAEKK